MRKTQVTVYLDADETAELDARAKRLGLSRSAYVSRLIRMDLATTVTDVAEQMLRLERDLTSTAQMMRVLVEARGPEAVREVAERMDARMGPGSHARFMRELEEEAGGDERGDKRRVRRRPGAQAGSDRGQDEHEAQRPPEEDGGRGDRGR